MNYESEMGHFTTLQELRYAYLQSGKSMCLDLGHANAHPWEESRLHASELGSCPRQQILRIRGAEKKVRANLTLANEALMYWSANRLHFLAYEALDWAGLLFGHEISLFDFPWAGRADALFTPDHKSEQLVLYDVKTVRPNAMKYTESFPKEAHCLQLGAYATKLPHVKQGIVEYVDRGGTNTPIECVVDLEPWRDKALEQMATLAKALDEQSLPPELGDTLVPHFRKERLKPVKRMTSVTLECDWRCGWCDYLHAFPPRHEGDDFPPLRKDSPCKPPWHEPETLAVCKGGKWSYLTQSDLLRDKVEALIASLPSTVPQIGGQDE